MCGMLEHGSVGCADSVHVSDVGKLGDAVGGAATVENAEALRGLLPQNPYPNPNRFQTMAKAKGLGSLVASSYFLWWS